MNPERIITKLRSSLKGRVLLHMMMWIFYFLAVYYLQSISFDAYQGWTAFSEVLKNTATIAFVFYPLVYLIYPLFYHRKKYLQSLLLLLLLIVLYAAANHMLERLIIESCEPCIEKLRLNKHGFYSLYQRGPLQVIIVQLVTLGIFYKLFVFLAFPLAVKILMEYIVQRIETIRLQQENTELEYNFLKAQVNPHFLFNTLNNIYALILKGDQQSSAETVSTLARFMRYSLDSGAEQRNNIMKETDLLKLYVELEKIRLSDTVVNFIRKIDHNDYHLPPLLFLPAIENAFKYCTKINAEEAYIFIRLEVEAFSLVFTISNTFEKTQQELMIRSGIGLQNMRRRLEHYYPGDRSLMKISDKEGIFQLSIHIKLAI